MPNPLGSVLGGLKKVLRKNTVQSGKNINLKAQPQGKQKKVTPDTELFIDRLAPGGDYFKYALVLIIISALVFFGLVVTIAFPNIKKLFTKTPPHIPSKVTCASPLPLAKGFQSWKFSYGDAVVGPKIGTATIDTLTPPPGSTQTLTLTIKNQTPVIKALATVYTDNSHESYELAVTKGTTYDGTWQGIWKLTDSTDCIYRIEFDLRSSSGNWTGALTFR